MTGLTQSRILSSWMFWCDVFSPFVKATVVGSPANKTDRRRQKHRYPHHFLQYVWLNEICCAKKYAHHTSQVVAQNPCWFISSICRLYFRRFLSLNDMHLHSSRTRDSSLCVRNVQYFLARMKVVLPSFNFDDGNWSHLELVVAYLFRWISSTNFILRKVIDYHREPIQASIDAMLD